MSYYVNGERLNGTPGPAKAGNQKGWQCKENRERNRVVVKAPANVAGALAAHGRIQAISTEIRGRAGLAPVAENDHIKAWRRMDAPEVAGSLSERAQAIRTARARVARAQAKVDRETAEIAAAVKGTREVSKVAAVLGLSRQRLYQLAA